MIARNDKLNINLTLQLNDELNSKFNKIKTIKALSYGATVRYCLNVASNNPINVELTVKDSDVTIKKTVRVSKNTIKALSKLKKEINNHTSMERDSEVWRYCIKLTYDVLVGSGNNDL